MGIGIFPAITCSELVVAAPTLPLLTNSNAGTPDCRAAVTGCAPEASQATKLPSLRQTPHQCRVLLEARGAMPVSPAMPVMRVSSPACRCNSPKATLSASWAFCRACVW